LCALSFKPDLLLVLGEQPAASWEEHVKRESLSYVLSFFFFFLRKISPELTTANPPLFAEEDWP
ncbi:hypothetical protein, partial [Klebsiella pneumoniae]|uniref:hypothetical protein n=1 Tax=Klebsiella pneumoniae TaxID=573 RepID=UPI001C71FD9C